MNNVLQYYCGKRAAPRIPWVLIAVILAIGFLWLLGYVGCFFVGYRSDLVSYKIANDPAWMLYQCDWEEWGVFSFYGALAIGKVKDNDQAKILRDQGGGLLMPSKTSHMGLTAGCTPDRLPTSDEGDGIAGIRVGRASWVNPPDTRIAMRVRIPYVTLLCIVVAVFVLIRLAKLMRR